MDKYVSFGPLGLNMLSNINFSIERGNENGFEVEAVSFDIDDYFPGLRGFDGRTELLSGARYPACAAASTVTGLKGTPTYKHEGARHPHDPTMIACDARWVTEEEYLTSGGAKSFWNSLPPNDQISTEISMTVHGNPEYLDDYSFYDYTSGSFHKNCALSFSENDKALLPPFSWTPLNGPVCLMGLFVLSTDVVPYSLMSVKTDNRILTLYYDRGSIVTRSQDLPSSEDTQVGKLTLSDTDIGIPVVVGLRYRTDYESVETFVKRGGKNNPLQTSNYRFPAGLTTLKWELLPSDVEKRVEILDVSLWRSNCWNNVFANAISGYTKGYGI